MALSQNMVSQLELELTVTLAPGVLKAPAVKNTELVELGACVAEVPLLKASTHHIVGSLKSPEPPFQ